MTSLIFIFVACIVVMFATVWVYNKKEDTAFHETLNKLTQTQVELKKVQEELSSHRTVVMNQNVKIKEFEDKVQCAHDELKKFKVEIDNLQEHCAKIREQQIQLKDQLANKRPVLKVTTPIPVQVVGSQTTQKADPKLINKIKKQIKDVSQ